MGSECESKHKEAEKYDFVKKESGARHIDSQHGQSRSLSRVSRRRRQGVWRWEPPGVHSPGNFSTGTATHSSLPRRQGFGKIWGGFWGKCSLVNHFIAEQLSHFIKLVHFLIQIFSTLWTLWCFYIDPLKSDQFYLEKINLFCQLRQELLLALTGALIVIVC